jgi:RNA polymerase sigma-70 factor (ECF subfamily)
MMINQQMSDAFLANLSEPGRREWQALADLEGRLAIAVNTARLAHEEVTLPVEQFMAYLAHKWPTGEDPERLSALLNLPDLYLVAACIYGCSAALARFDALLRSHVPRYLGYLRQGNDFVGEVEQTLRVKLLAAADGEDCKLADYSGRGALQMWLRAAAIRTALNHLDRAEVRKRVSDADEAILDALPSGGSELGRSPELTAMKSDVKPVVKAALQAALQALDRDQRTLVRLYYVEEMRMERLAELLRVNKSTVSRRIADAREAIHCHIIRYVSRELKLQPTEVESLVNLVISQLELSLPRLLHSQPEDE